MAGKVIKAIKTTLSKAKKNVDDRVYIAKTNANTKKGDQIYKTTKAISVSNKKIEDNKKAGKVGQYDAYQKRINKGLLSKKQTELDDLAKKQSKINKKYKY